MKRKRFFCLLLTAAVVFTMFPAAALAGTATQYIDQNGEAQTADATPIDGTTSALTDGWYVVSGSVTHSGTITVTGDVNLILADDSSLTVTGDDTEAGIDVTGGSLTIYGQTKGNGRLTATGTGGGAGIGSGKDAAAGGTVNIAGGTVSATGNGGGPGLGGGSGSAGCLVNIRGGVVTATGIEGGAGIGGGESGDAGTVSIRGGTVTANGIDGGAGIGTGDAGTVGIITIAGGTVKSSGIGGTALNKPAAEGGVNVYLTTVTLADASDTAVGNAAIAQMGINASLPYGTKNMRTDAGGKLYLYLPNDTLTTAAQTKDGTAYTSYRGSVQTKNDGTASGTLKVGGPPAQNIAVGGKVRFTAATLGFGQLPITGASTANTAIATVQLSGGAVMVSGVSAGQTTVTVTYSNGSTEPVTIKTYMTDFVVTTDNPAGYSYNPSDGALRFTESGSYTVSMKSGVTTTTANKIQVLGGTAAEPVIITLNNVGIKSGSVAIDCKDYVKLMSAAGTTNTVSSGGSNAGIRCLYGAHLVIDGPGTLKATGAGSGAGIGSDSGGDSSGAVTITGGTVMATGGASGGAGIGGGTSRSSGTITITGGTVTARAVDPAPDYDPGAGIGGGAHGNSGPVIINGGTVTAIGGSQFIKGQWEYLDRYEGGAGIGGGFEADGGTVTITGGSVKATAGLHADNIGGGTGRRGSGTITNGRQEVSVRALYDVVSATNPKQVTYDIPLVSGGEKISYAYTGKGHGNGDANLYFWLPLGEFTTTSLTSSKNPVNPGGTVTFTATVKTASGGVAQSGDATFYDGDTPLGTVAVNGNGIATYTTSSLTAARHPIKVKYYGAENQCYGNVSGVLTQRVVNEPILDVSQGNVNITSGGTYRITGSTTENAITISTSQAVTAILDNVSVDYSASGTYKCPLDSGANVTLLLEGTNTLKSNPNDYGSSYNQPAVKVEGTDTLTIDNDTGSSGTLTAVGAYYMPGIGGGYKQKPGAVTVNGGTVSAAGGEHGAGIGGGEIVAGGSVTVTGGRVSAQGGSWAAGIGGGSKGAGGTVRISGGYVTATGGDMGAGIGGGHTGAGGNVTITDGTVTATGGLQGSGIGGGYKGAGGTVKITGGSVKAAQGRDSAAAPIGQGGYISASGTITNGFEAVALRIVADMVDAENPQTLTYEAPIISNGNSYTYRYTGKGHGGGDTNLYFYLPEAISIDVPGAETLRDSATGIEVTGDISEGAVLTVGEMKLGTDAASRTILQWMNDENHVFLLGVDISLSGSFTGQLTIAIPVGAQHDGEAVTILHARHDGTLETLSATVKDGKATFKVTSLSPFAVFAKAGSELDDIPRAGDDSAPWVWWLLLGASAAGVAVQVILSKRRKACKR